MPELPDIEAYLHALRTRVQGDTLQGVRLKSVFVLRSVAPPLGALAGRPVVGLRRLGKRIVVELSEEHYLVLHLMIAGRLQWKPAGAKIPGRVGLAALDFGRGTLVLTEAGSQRRAALHAVLGLDELPAHDPGGMEPVGASQAELLGTLKATRHTLKRALTDPHVLAGIGNAYSDEILHAARLSPFKLARSLSDEEGTRLYGAIQAVLSEWCERLRAEAARGFPTQVTAFRPEFAAHGRYGEPCPACAAPIQRIVYGRREANYCARCQTAGKVLADRSLSRLLKADWPRTIEDLEAGPPQRKTPRSR